MTLLLRFFPTSPASKDTDIIHKKTKMKNFIIVGLISIAIATLGVILADIRLANPNVCILAPIS